MGKTQIKRGLAFLLLTLVTQAYASSPLYITVERSFGTKDEPVFRLDTSNSREIISVRILKPQDNDRFLDGQLELARSYEPAEKVYNPAHAFSKGLNRLESPVLKLRQLLNFDFRKDLIARQKPLANSVRGRHARAVTAENPETLVSAPAGFEIIKTLQLSPQFGFEGNQGSLNMGGDEDGYSSNFLYREVKLPLLPSGLYLIQVIQGQVEAQALLQVSDLSVLVTRSDRSLIFRAIDSRGVPSAGVKFRQRGGDGKWSDLAGTTDEAGQLFIRSSTSLPERLVFEGRDGNGVSSFTDTEFLSNADDEQSLLMLTDRPIFKPGDQVSFKGIVREGRPGQWKLPTAGATNVRFASFDSSGRIIASQAKISSHGSFTGTFQIDENETPGLYQVQAELGQKVHKGELRVRDYVKPTFYVTQELTAGAVRPGETATIKLNAVRYAGGPMSDGRYEYYVYRKLIDIPQFVEDAGGALQAGMSYSGEMNRSVPSAVPVKIMSSIDSREISYQNEENGSTFKGAWSSAPAFNANGEATLTLIIPAEDKKVATQEYQLVVMVRAMDSQGAEATTSATHFVTRSEASVALAWPQPLLRAGEDVQVRLTSRNMKGGEAPEASGQWEVFLIGSDGKEEKLDAGSFKTDANGLGQFKLKLPGKGGQLRALALLKEVQGRPMKVPFQSAPALAWNAPAGESNQPLAKDASLDVIPIHSSLQPAGRTQLFVLLPNEWGKDRRGPIWITVSGAGIHQVDHKMAQGYSTWIDVEAKPEYGTGFFVTVAVPLANGQFAEATRAFSIINKDQQLAVDIRPESRATEPLKPFKIKLSVTNHEGKPSARTELAVGIVDKAIYDLQKEMRPSVYDFFYPTPRLNLMSFRSRELQGYGYGDVLRYANFKLKSIKSTSLFNALFRDTAGFFPQVVTDDQGQAEVTVNMPANLTEWVITAIAVDDQTRVGESTAIFRTSSDISMVAVGPQFTRSGEKFEFSVRYSNSLGKPVAVQSAAQGSDGLKFDKALAPGTLNIAAKESLISTALISSEGNRRDRGEGQLKFTAQTDPAIRLGLLPPLQLPILPAGLDVRWMRTFPVVTPGKMNLDLGLPAKEGELKEIEILAVQGLMGAVLARADMLSTYPYGCTEQLVHSTLPNVALLSAFSGQSKLSEKSVSAMKFPLGPYEGIMKDSYRKAQKGLALIMKNQDSEGGFAFFPGAPTSVDLTALVADAFFEAQSLGFLEVNPSLSRMSDFIRRSWSSRSRDLPISGLSPRAMRIGAWFGAIPKSAVKTWMEYAARNGTLQEVNEALKILNPIVGSPHIDANLGRSVEFAGLIVPLKARFVSHLWTLNIASLRQDYYGRVNFVNFGTFDRSDDPFSRSTYLPFGSLAAVADFARSADVLGILTPDRRSEMLKQITQLLLSEIGQSTYNSGRAILSLQPFFKEEIARNKAEGWAEVQVKTSQGQSLGHFKSTMGGAILRAPVTPDMKRLDLLEVQGLPLDTIALSSVVQAYLPYKIMEAGHTGIEVERQLYQVENGKAKLLSGRTHRFKVGDTIISVVRVQRKKIKQWNWEPSGMIVVQDAMPSLFQSFEDEKAVLAGVELPEQLHRNFDTLQTLRYPDRTERIVRAGWWSERPLSVLSVWRAAFRGQATVPAAVSFDMYADGVRGYSSAGEVDVL